MREKSANAISVLKNNNFDALILCIAWIPSYAVIRTADPFKNLPMILWGLCGTVENGKLTSTADQAGTSALRKPMTDLGFNIKYVYDTIDGIKSIDTVERYLNILRAKKELMTAKSLMMGYRDMNLYGTMFDGISLKEKTGIEIEFVEMLDMVRRSEKVSNADVEYYIRKIKANWKFTSAVDDNVLTQGIRYFLALKEIVLQYDYKAISLIDVDGMKKLLSYPPSLIFMLLSSELGICTIPENDSLGSATQLIAKSLIGQAAAYLEF